MHVVPSSVMLGVYSLVFVVEMVCFVHLCVCAAVVSMADSVRAIQFASLQISPFSQCTVAAWCLLGVPVIISAGVGSVYREEVLLLPYLFYLFGTFLACSIWTFIFVMYGNACVTNPGTSAVQSATYVCGLVNGMTIFWMIIALGSLLSTIYLVWCLLDYIRIRRSTELISYSEPFAKLAALASEASAQQKDHIDSVNPNIAVPAFSGSQPIPQAMPMLNVAPGTVPLPGMMPCAMPGTIPGAMAGAMPCTRAGAMPCTRAGPMPCTMAGAMPCTMAGAMPCTSGVNQRAPGAKSVMMPGYPVPSAAPYMPNLKAG